VIQLTDSTFIDAPPEDVWTWLERMPLHDKKWHPDHVICRYERGQVLQTGTVLHVEERLLGRLQRLRLRATAVVPGRLARYRSRGFAGTFVAAPEGEGTQSTAELSFGTSAPIVGRTLDAVASLALRSRLEAFQTHVREEGENLRRLLQQERGAE
jgi:hypothetical protein